MIQRGAPLVLALVAGCRDEPGTCEAPPDFGCVGATSCARDVRDATCTGPIWQCDPTDGEWLQVGSCQPETMVITGEVTLSMQITEQPAACPAGLMARESLVLVADASGLRLTATAPAVVVSDEVDREARPAELILQLDDVWSSDAGELPLRLLYVLDLEDDGTIRGGGGTHVSDDCLVHFDVVGRFTPTWRLDP